MMKRSDIAAVRRCDEAATGSPPFWPDEYGHTVKKKQEIYNIFIYITLFYFTIYYHTCWYKICGIFY